MESKAVAKYLRISPQKLRLVANEIRGYRYVEAVALLRFMNKKGADLLLELLRSAYANLVYKKKNIKSGNENLDLNNERVFIQELVVDKGPIAKRWTSRARGRSSRILKRSSSVTVHLLETEN